jgi:hypothetical protein
MKRLAVVAVAALISACTCDKPAVIDAGVPDAGPLALTEKEPNDGPDKALAIAGAAIVQANLGADPKAVDEDWYVVTSALPRTAAISVTAPTGADVSIEAMDEARTTLLSVNATGAGETEKLPNLDVSGRAFFRVLGLKKGAGGAYAVTVTFSDRQPGFELEPNNRQVDATPVALGQAVSGFLSHPQDEDWYRFELPGAAPELGAPAEDAGAAVDAGDSTDGGGDGAGDPGMGGIPNAGGETDAGVVAVPEAEKVPLRLDISAVDGVRPEVTVLTIAEAVLFGAKAGQDGAGLSLRNVGIRAQDKVIFVVVKSAAAGTGKDARKGHNAQTYYTLTVSPEEAGASAELEPNDNAEQATALPADAWKEGFLSPRGDADYFRLTVAQPSIADITVTGVDNLDIQLSLVKPGEPGGKGEEVLAKANEGAVKEPESLHSLTCEKECVLKVEAAARKVDGKWVKDQENGEMAYRISTTVLPDDGTREKEPNNTPEHGSPISLSASVRGTVYPKKDVDLFKLDLTGKQVKTPLKATLTGILKVDVALYLHRLGEDGKLELMQTSDRAKGDKPEVVRFSAEPGTYLFEVRDVKNREANIQDQYQLTVEESDD